MFGADAAAHIRASKVRCEDKCSARKAYYRFDKILLNMIYLVQGCVERVSVMIHAYKVIQMKALLPGQKIDQYLDLTRQICKNGKTCG